MGESYERLSFLDSSFLAMEDENSHFHVAGVMVFESGGLATADGGVDIQRIRAFVASRLHQVPRYRQKLAWIPLERHPVWVDDDHFDIDYHVRHVRLPLPEGEVELKRLARMILSEKLERGRPLWQLWVVEGVGSGQFALIGKAHHCMIDGVAAVEIMTVLMDFAPVERFEPGPTFVPRASISRAELLGREMVRRARSPFESLFRLRGEEASELVRTTQQRLGAAARALGSGWLQNAPSTPINARIGPNRDFDWMTVPLDDVKAVKNALGGTVNDVLLATVAGALRNYLGARRVEPDRLGLRAMVPVSTRRDSDSLGNRVAMWLLDLPIDEPSPRRRLQRIAARTAELKAANHAMGAASLVQAGSFMPSSVLQQAARLAARSGFRPFNLTITNVPGPQIPVYFLEAQLLVHYPMVPLWFNHGLGFAIFSYNGEVAWGVVSDADSITDLDRLIAGLGSAHAELVKLATPPRRSSVKKPKSTSKPTTPATRRTRRS